MVGASPGQMDLSCIRNQAKQSKEQAGMWHFSVVSASIHSSKVLS